MWTVSIVVSSTSLISSSAVSNWPFIPPSVVFDLDIVVFISRSLFWVFLRTSFHFSPHLALVSLWLLEPVEQIFFFLFKISLSANFIISVNTESVNKLHEMKTTNLNL